MISVLLSFWYFFRNLLKNGGIFASPSLTAVSVNLLFCVKITMKKACERNDKSPLHQRGESRYQNASLTVEASVAFPVFFFAVLYLIQMFSVLQAEVMIAEAGLTSAREIAAYSYVAERLAEGDIVQADKLAEVFDQKIVRDASMTALFYARCDRKVLEEGKVARGLGGIWVNTEDAGDRVRASIKYRVTPVNVWKSEKGRYYTMRIVYRPWTGEGEVGGVGSPEQPRDDKTVYVTKQGTVYHTDRNCTYINISTQAIHADSLENLRNEAGAKYYPCAFCLPAVEGTVYITDYGTCYHRVSSCSAIRRGVTEVSLEKVKDTYRSCSKCGKDEEEN